VYRPGALRGRHGVVDVLDGRLCEGPERDVLVDRGPELIGAVTLPLLAVDHRRVKASELRLRLLDALLVALVELLVVGGHRRVGDSELLCHCGFAPLLAER
jgi:hypothetical protein